MTVSEKQLMARSFGGLRKMALQRSSTSLSLPDLQAKTGYERQKSLFCASAANLTVKAVPVHNERLFARLSRGSADPAGIGVRLGNGLGIPVGMLPFPAARHYRLAGCRVKDALRAPPRGRAAPGPRPGLPARTGMGSCAGKRGRNGVSCRGWQGRRLVAGPGAACPKSRRLGVRAGRAGN